MNPCDLWGELVSPFLNLTDSENINIRVILVDAPLITFKLVG